MVEIDGRAIGGGAPVYVIAEISANHGQRIEVALDTIVAVAESGADAVKIQTYTPDTITFPSDREWFKISGGTIWDGRALYDLYAEAYTPWEWHADLFACARRCGITIFSSPFDPTAVDLLVSLNAPAYKIASFEIVDIPLIRYAALQGKPMIISTGIATEHEIQAAVFACHDVGNRNVVLLKCTSSYPARFEDMNLKTIADMQTRFRVPVGLSDHSIGPTVAVVATALGACVIEKHVILDRALGGPDASFSMTPDEFSQMIQAVRGAEASVGIVTYELPESARVSRSHARSLFVVEDVRAGDPVSVTNVRSIRPSAGLPPSTIDQLRDACFVKAVEAGTPLALDMLDGVTARRSEGDEGGGDALTTYIAPGWRELTLRPSALELEEHYTKSYFQDEGHGEYKKLYDELELEFIQNNIKRVVLAVKTTSGHCIHKVLDIGCGEGHALAFFKEYGWDVLGIDLSSHGVRTHHPALIDQVVVGDVLPSLEKLLSEQSTFDLIWLDNVLEHVLDPSVLLTMVAGLLSPEGVAVVHVPNDFSPVQNELVRLGLIPDESWIFSPDHISYFSREGLSALVASCGLRELTSLSDFPIDW